MSGIDRTDIAPRHLFGSGLCHNSRAASKRKTGMSRLGPIEAIEEVREILFDILCYTTVAIISDIIKLT